MELREAGFDVVLFQPRQVRANAVYRLRRLSRRALDADPLIQRRLPWRALDAFSGSA
ncbi:hypothetical protein [Methylocystis bryophila]|uniref:hypothetical protein n=1 Tax=Methylocystis bryophila TaxID=655015 RepID=UPI001319FAF4|nr:hypothetical protein [Methylocystis bryophila]